VNDVAEEVSSLDGRASVVVSKSDGRLGVGVEGISDLGSDGLGLGEGMRRREEGTRRKTRC